jgi:hypothetical protein
MASSVEMCAICAWRETCNKKFSLSGRDVHCPDFSEDVSISRKPDKEEEGQEQGEG